MIKFQNVDGDHIVTWINARWRNDHCRASQWAHNSLSGHQYAPIMSVHAIDTR